MKQSLLGLLRASALSLIQMHCSFSKQTSLIFAECERDENARKQKRRLRRARVREAMGEAARKKVAKEGGEEAAKAAEAADRREAAREEEGKSTGSEGGVRERQQRTKVQLLSDRRSREE